MKQDFPTSESQQYIRCSEAFHSSLLAYARGCVTELLFQLGIKCDSGGSFRNKKIRTLIITL